MTEDTRAKADWLKNAESFEYNMLVAGKQNEVCARCGNKAADHTVIYGICSFDGRPKHTRDIPNARGDLYVEYLQPGYVKHLQPKNREETWNCRYPDCSEPSREHPTDEKMCPTLRFDEGQQQCKRVADLPDYVRGPVIYCQSQ